VTGTPIFDALVDEWWPPVTVGSLTLEWEDAAARIEELFGHGPIRLIEYPAPLVVTTPLIRRAWGWEP
jgi:hypothetical protein